MAAGAFEADLSAPFGVAVRGGGGAAGASALALFSYTILTAIGTTNPAVPAGAKGLIAHAIGAGGTGYKGASAGGGGGAYTQSETVPVTETSTVSVTVGNAQRQEDNYPQDGAPSSVSVNGTVIAFAEQGYAAKPGVGGRGGLAANCIGKVRRTGGTGGTPSISSTAAEGGFPATGTGFGGSAAGNYGAPAGGIGDSAQGTASSAPGGGGGYNASSTGSHGYVLLQWLR